MSARKRKSEKEMRKKKCEKKKRKKAWKKRGGNGRKWGKCEKWRKKVLGGAKSRGPTSNFRGFFSLRALYEKHEKTTSGAYGFNQALLRRPKRAKMALFGPPQTLVKMALHTLNTQNH